VAVLDTGIAAENPGLAGAVPPESGNGDISWQGTFSAGIIAGATQTPGAGKIPCARGGGKSKSSPVIACNGKNQCPYAT